VSDLGNRLAQANSALEQANAKRDEAQGLAKQTTDTLNKERADAAKQLEDARKNYNAELAKTKELLTKANADTKKALDENTALAEKAKKDLAELQAKLQRAAQDIQVLKDEVERKKPKQLAVQEGHVLQADLVEGVVILDLGTREGIQTGEKFTIMNIGKGGKRIPKAEVQVVKVEDLISRADIIKHSLDDPIVREDIAQREKKVEPVD
jgi:DNA repair exonuclease SbcCD ATPase subunit